MKQQMCKPVRAPGMRSVLEGMRRLETEVVCWDEQEQETKLVGREAQGAPIEGAMAPWMMS
jgi:hypothetical protein